MEKRKWLLISLITLTCFLLVASTTTSTLSGNNDWLMFHHDPAHSSYTTSNNSGYYPKPLWNYTTGAAVVSSPAIADGLAFVGSKDYNIYCLNTSNGRVVWSFATGNEIDSSPAIYGGCVYVGSNDGWFYCLNISSGMPIWVSVVEGQVQSSPAVVDGRVYVGSGKHDFYCFNASDGSLLWVYPIDSPVKSSPAVVANVVYFAADNYYVYALNATSGQEIWREHTGSQSDSPCVYNGYLYTGSYDGFVWALNASTGSKVWQYRTNGVVASSPAAAGGCVYVGSDDNNVYCLDALTGAKIWSRATGYWVRSSAALVASFLYVGSQDYNVYCLDAVTGAKLWSVATYDYVDSSPVITNGVLYIGSNDRHIYAYEVNDPNVAILVQSRDSLNWNTVLFDALTVAVFVIVVFEIIRFQKTKSKPSAEALYGSPSKWFWFHRHVDAICILALLAFSIIYFLNLSGSALWASDEQTYSQWAFHMYRSGDYLTPWAFGGVAVWIGKPPLFEWFITLAYQVFGANNFAARVWSPIFAALTLVLIFFFGKLLCNRYVGLVSALVLGTFSTFYVFARHAMTDMVFTFFIVASIYFFIQDEKTNQKTSHYLVLSGVFFGLALLTKQVQALLIPLIIFAYLLATKQSIRFLFTKRLTVFWALGLALFLPWLIYMFVSYGSDFWQWFVVYCGVLRTTSPLEGHSGGLLYYFVYLANVETVWAIFLIFASVLCIFNAAFKRLKQDTLLFVWMAVVLAIFTVAQTKLEWYILPAFPAFALAIGSLLHQIGRFVGFRLRKRLK